MDSSLAWIQAVAEGNLWVVQVFVVVFFVLLFNSLQQHFLKKLYRALQKTDKVWDDALIKALRRPLTLLVWIVGIAFAARIVQTKTGAVIFEAINPMRDVGVIACITWFLLRLVSQVEHNVVEKQSRIEKEIDRTTIDAIGKLVRISFVITAALVILQTLGYSISGVLAFGGIGGVAVGFAAKDLLANFFGGLIVYLDRPFAVGDWIRSPDRNIEGTVEKIGWRLTVIRTFDKRPLYVPNSTFASIAVENPSRMTNRRIYETIGVRYDDIDKMAAITKDVNDMLLNHSDIDTSKTLMVNFDSFAPSSLDFFVYTFTKTTNWTEFHKIKQDILLKISHIIASHGAEIAFPTSTVHLTADSVPLVESAETTA